MRKQHIITIIASLFVLASCQEKIDNFEVGGAEGTIIIEGEITDSVRQHPVRVTQVANFYKDPTIPVINNAIVELYEDDVLFQTYSSVGNGYYQTPTAFAGQPNKTYRLEVTVNGVKYTAQDILPNNPEFYIDSVVARYDDEIAEAEIADKGGYGQFNVSPTQYIFGGDSLYGVYFYAKESKLVKNYYYFEFFRNGLKNKDPFNIFISDDAALAENISNLEGPGYYVKGDTITSVMYGLTPIGYAFFQGLQNVLVSDGGMFSPPVENPPTNFNNGAWGFYWAANEAHYITIIK